LRCVPLAPIFLAPALARIGLRSPRVALRRMDVGSVPVVENSNTRTLIVVFWIVAGPELVAAPRRCIIFLMASRIRSFPRDQLISRVNHLPPPIDAEALVDPVAALRCAEIDIH
jgi:hypothetical protein